MMLDRWEAQLLGDLGVLDPTSLLQSHATNQLGQVAGTRNGAATAEGLELDIGDTVIARVDANLELHDIATGGCTD